MFSGFLIFEVLQSRFLPERSCFPGICGGSLRSSLKRWGRPGRRRRRCSTPMGYAAQRSLRCHWRWRWQRRKRWQEAERWGPRRPDGRRKTETELLVFRRPHHTQAGTWLCFLLTFLMKARRTILSSKPPVLNSSLSPYEGGPSSW